MYDILLQMLLGWPAMFVSLGFALAGILLKKVSLSLTGAVVCLAPAWYLSHYSFLLGSLPFFLLLSAQAVSRKKIVLAFLCIVPLVLVMGILGYLVLNQ